MYGGYIKMDKINEKNKENLNTNNKYSKYMEESYEEDYNALKYYVDNKRDFILKDKKNPVSREVEKRLEDLKYIDYNKESDDLYHPDYIFTKKGNEQYLKLKEIWQKNWAFWLALAAFLLAVFNLYLYYKNTT